MQKKPVIYMIMYIKCYVCVCQNKLLYYFISVFLQGFYVILLSTMFLFLCLQSILVVLRNRCCDVMVSIRSSNVTDCKFDARSGQTKDHKMGICCFSFNHATLRYNGKDWWTPSEGN